MTPPPLLQGKSKQNNHSCIRRICLLPLSSGLGCDILCIVCERQNVHDRLLRFDQCGQVRTKVSMVGGCIFPSSKQESFTFPFQWVSRSLWCGRKQHIEEPQHVQQPSTGVCRDFLRSRTPRASARERRGMQCQCTGVPGCAQECAGPGHEGAVPCRHLNISEVPMHIEENLNLCAQSQKKN